MEDSFYSIIETALQKRTENMSVARSFLSGSHDIRRYLVGKNQESSNLTNLVKIDGIIDDYALPGTSWNDIPVISGKVTLENAIVVNCSTSISPVDVENRLLAAGWSKVLSVKDILDAKESQLPLPWFVTDMRTTYNAHKDKFHDLFGILSDDVSRKTLLDITKYRLTADNTLMSGYLVRPQDQYFEDFLNLKGETFVDCGGFDGDTTLEFCRRYPDYKKIYFFEPSVSNMETAVKHTAAVRDISYYQVGLSDCEGELLFNSQAGPASSVLTAESTGADVIKVSLLDSVVSDRVSFIKMDIEGWELPALKGAEVHIINDRPKLAIAVYHAAKDFFEIPDYLLSLVPGYRVYMRHYTQGWSETVMYFVPPKGL